MNTVASHFQCSWFKSHLYFRVVCSVLLIVLVGVVIGFVPYDGYPCAHILLEMHESIKSLCLCVLLQGETFALLILVGWTWGCWQYPLCAQKEVSSVILSTHSFPPYRNIKCEWDVAFVLIFNIYCVFAGAGHWLCSEATAKQVLIRTRLTPSLAYPSLWQMRAIKISIRSGNSELLIMHLGGVKNEPRV